MQELVDFWRLLYYTEPIMFITQIFALIAAIQRIKLEKAAWIFAIYIIADVILFIIDSLLMIMKICSPRQLQTFFYTSNHIIVGLEVVIYYTYFKKILDLTKLATLLNILPILALTIITFSILNRFDYPPLFYPFINYKAYAFALLILIIPCIIYYYQIFIKYNTTALIKRPSFWIVTGIFIYSLLSIPYYILQSYFLKSDYSLKNLFAAIFYYIPITINYLLLYKGLKCKPIITI